MPCHSFEAFSHHIQPRETTTFAPSGAPTRCRLSCLKTFIKFNIFYRRKKADKDPTSPRLPPPKISALLVIVDANTFLVP